MKAIRRNFVIESCAPFIDRRNIPFLSKIRQSGRIISFSEITLCSLKQNTHSPIESLSEINLAASSLNGVMATVACRRNQLVVCEELGRV